MMNEKLNETPTPEQELTNTNENQEEKLEVNSRKERKRRKKEHTEDEVAPKKTFWVQLRILPIWLRIILFILLLAAVIVIGLRFGYGFIGDGNPADVLKKETWTHILDIIQGKE